MSISAFLSVSAMISSRHLWDDRSTRYRFLRNYLSMVTGRRRKGMFFFMNVFLTFSYWLGLTVRTEIAVDVRRVSASATSFAYELYFR